MFGPMPGNEATSFSMFGPMPGNEAASFSMFGPMPGNEANPSPCLVLCLGMRVILLHVWSYAWE